jgi:hypothetical protein
MPDHDLHLAAPPTPQEVELLRLLRGVRYGQIVVQVHDGRVVQIERTERYRTDAREGSRSA